MKIGKTALAEFFLTQAPHWIDAIGADFEPVAIDHQLPPERADSGEDWTTWLILGGRGAGKTRAGAEWVRRTALADPNARIALIGEGEHETREVMVEGVSGVLAVHRPDERPEWIPTRRMLKWKEGAVAQVFSSEDPECLRGPQFSAAWLDELAKWRHAEATFDMLQFGLRLGGRPRQVVTTTPRPTDLLKRLMADTRTAITHAGTRANAYNLAPAFVETVLQRYHGTRLGRQEIDGEIIEERARRAVDAGAHRSRAGDGRAGADAYRGGNRSARFGAQRRRRLRHRRRRARPRRRDFRAGRRQRAGLTPQGWATKAIALWRRLEADALVAEMNFGGDMVRAVIREVDRNVPVMAVRATRGKYLRAEPVAQLYEQGRVHHVGMLPGAGGRDVRLRPRRAVVGPLARPARCAGLGGDGSDARGAGGAAGEGDLRLRVPGAAQHDSVALLTRDPGSFKLASSSAKPGSRVCGAPLRAAPRPGHASEPIAEVLPRRILGFDQLELPLAAPALELAFTGASIVYRSILFDIDEFW